MATIDVEALQAKVKKMYRLVAEQPHGNYHLELGRSLAERLGSHPELLHRIPAASLFATSRTSSASIRAAGHTVTLISRIGYQLISQRARDASTR